ncbi:MAG: hypothetical protein KME64_42520 [Scytonematopsis contorta HA4267-MV1]|nr:hypothetical protein [Scytonematopsis contorta HA4267-MV1]
MTKLETILVVVLVVLGVGIVALFFLVLNKGEEIEPKQIRSDAQKSLAEFAKSADLQTIDCVSQDPDKNKYVECTARDKRSRLLTLECAYGKNKGCKIQKIW